MDKRIDNPALIGIFGALSVLSIGIIFSYSSLPQWSIYIAIPSIIAMFFILLIISPIPEIIKRKNDIRNRNKLTRKYFQKFKEENYMDNFNTISSVDYAFHHIVNKLKECQKEEFGILSNPEIRMITTYFNFLRCIYNNFKYKDKINYEDFMIIFNGFNELMIEYHRICIKEQYENITKISQDEKVKINDEFINEWKLAVGDYDDLQKRYNQFVYGINSTFATNSPLLPPANEIRNIFSYAA